MEVLVGQRPYYETLEIIGEGATGRVFKALRWDRQYATQQLVAIKIIKSKKDVSILRNEFSRLKSIRSPHCVQLLAWENLNLGAALILEYLEGMNLFELAQWVVLDRLLIQEIVGQVQLGLKALSEQGAFHGDLSPKNIFVTSGGVVKLIDFGSEHTKKKVFANPDYLAPELLETRQPNLASDLFSLGIIENQLQNGTLGKASKVSFEDLYESNTFLKRDENQRNLKNYRASARQQKRLAQYVEQARENRHSHQQTQFLGSHVLEVKWVTLASALCFVTFFLMPMAPMQKVSMGSVDIRVHGWAEVYVNGLPVRYAPILLSGLRPGAYDFRWRKHDQWKEKKLNINGENLVFHLEKRGQPRDRATTED